MVIDIGGGKILDTAKAVAYYRSVPVLISMRDLLSGQKKAMIPVIVLFFHFTYAILFSHQNGVPPDIDVLNYIMPWGKRQVFAAIHFRRPYSGQHSDDEKTRDKTLSGTGKIFTSNGDMFTIKTDIETPFPQVVYSTEGIPKRYSGLCRTQPTKERRIL